MEKIRVCTITHQNVPNYGAALQTYALQKKLDRLGVKNEVLNYDSERVKKSYYRSFKLCRTLKQKLAFILYYKFRQKYRKFDGFILNNLKLSAPYSKSELDSINNKYDLFVTGSDQVWNLSIHQEDTTHMLDFVSDDRKKGSYAASFGYSEIPEKYKAVTYNQLKRMQYFLLREETGVKILDELNINHESRVVLDPTLLLNKADYLKITAHNCQRNFILVYDLIGSTSLKEFALNLASKENLKIVCINTSLKRNKKMKNIYNAGPEEFLSLIANAQYVVTSSYHGIIFSIVFEKNFYYALNMNKTNNNSRIVDLSKKLSFESRNIDVFKQIVDVDYTIVNEKLNLLRTYSVAALKQMINDTEKGINNGN